MPFRRGEFSSNSRPRPASTGADLRHGADHLCLPGINRVDQPTRMSILRVSSSSVWTRERNGKGRYGFAPEYTGHKRAATAQPRSVSLQSHDAGVVLFQGEMDTRAHHRGKEVRTEKWKPWVENPVP